MRRIQMELHLGPSLCRYRNKKERLRIGVWALKLYGHSKRTAFLRWTSYIPSFLERGFFFQTMILKHFIILVSLGYYWQQVANQSLARATASGRWSFEPGSCFSVCGTFAVSRLGNLSYNPHAGRSTWRDDPTKNAAITVACTGNTVKELRNKTTIPLGSTFREWWDDFSPSPPHNIILLCALFRSNFQCISNPKSLPSSRSCILN